MFIKFFCLCILQDLHNFFIREIELYSSYFDVLLTASTVGGNATSLAVKDAESLIQYPGKLN